MSFDTEKKDQHERILCYHPESDCYFVLNSRAQFDADCEKEPCIDDVTDVPHHEAEYKRRLEAGEL